MSNGPFLYPNVTSIPGQGTAEAEKLREKRNESQVKGEFDQVFNKTLGTELAKSSENARADLNQIKPNLKFSAHASQRLKDRNIQLEPALLAKVNEAVEKADSKGIQDTLVLTKDAALIVNVPNRTVITAMDRSQLVGNVFTNIDGAIVV